MSSVAFDIISTIVVFSALAFYGRLLIIKYNGSRDRIDYLKKEIEEYLEKGA
jgi:hypothetical protein